MIAAATIASGCPDVNRPACDPRRASPLSAWLLASLLGITMRPHSCRRFRRHDSHDRPRSCQAEARRVRMRGESGSVERQVDGCRRRPRAPRVPDLAVATGGSMPDGRIGCRPDAQCRAARWTPAAGGEAARAVARREQRADAVAVHLGIRGNRGVPVRCHTAGRRDGSLRTCSCLPILRLKEPNGTDQTDTPSGDACAHDFHRQH